MIIVLFAVLGAALATSLFVSKAINRSYFSPFAVLTVMWAVSLTLFALSPRPYPNLSEATWLLIGIFWFTALVGTVLGASIPVGAAKRVRSRGLRVGYFYIIDVFCLLGACLYLYEVVSVVGFVALWVSPDAVRKMHFSDEINVGKLSSTYAVAFLYASAILSGIHSVTLERRPVLVLIPIISAVIIDYAFVGRTYIITVLFLLFCSRYLASRLVEVVPPFPKVIKIGGLAIMAIVLTHVTLARYLDGRSASDGLFVYYTSTWTVLDMHVSAKHVLNLGAQSFYPIFLVLSKLHLFDLSHFATITESYVDTPYGIWSNAPTAIAPLYVDYGWMGVAVFSGFFFAFATVVVNQFRRVRSLGAAILVTWCFYIAFISLHGLPLSSVSFVIAILLTSPAVSLRRLGRDEAEARTEQS